MSLLQKHLLGMQGVSEQAIMEILAAGETMKSYLQQDTKKFPHLQGKSIVTLFYENSTRTRMSFELASKYMSAASANIAASASSVAKGETLIDTGKTLDHMGVDIIIMRHPLSGAPHLLSQYVKASVINAGDGMNEHPTQALLDLYTIKEKKGGFKGLKVAIVGDIAHSRVARSNLWALQTLGAKVFLAGPSTLLPPEIAQSGAVIMTDIDQAVMQADVVMALRIQLERQQKGLFPSVREYSQLFGINSRRLALAKRDVLIMHPGPMNRGVEISSDVADSYFSSIDEQVTNGVAIRMALMYLLTRRAVA